MKLDETPKTPGTLEVREKSAQAERDASMLATLIRHRFDETYGSRVEMWQEGGYSLERTTANERLSSLLLPEIRERRGLFEEYQNEIRTLVPGVAEEQRGDLEALNEPLSREIRLLAMLEEVVDKLWRVRGGPAELAASVRGDEIAQKVIGVIDAQDEVKEYLAPSPSGGNMASVREELLQSLETISPRDSAPGSQSPFVEEVVQQLRAEIDELGRASGTS